MNTAIILAGGVGSRVGANVPKQFIEVNGKPVLVYTIEIYQKHPGGVGPMTICSLMKNTLAAGKKEYYS